MAILLGAVVALDDQQDPSALESGSVELAAATKYVPVLIVRAPATELFADDQRSLLLPG